MEQRISRLSPRVARALVILAVVFSGSAGRMSAAPMDPAAAAPPAGESRLGAPVVLRADPEVSRHRTPPPTGAVSAMRVATAEIAIDYLSDDDCHTWPIEAQTAFRYAADIWETLVDSSVVIVVEACWASLEGSYLGYSRAYMDRDFSGAPEPNTWYAIALANALHGDDLDQRVPDMVLTYNKKLHDTNEWYFGTDGDPPSDQYDFASVVLHEIAHGLGFSGSMSVSSDGEGSWGRRGDPYIYDHFTQDLDGNRLINTGFYPNPSIALGNALTSDSVWFSGLNADVANDGKRVRLHAPSTWQEGSSYTHLHDDFNRTKNALMTYSLKKDESNHSPGPVSMGILQDVGWVIEEGPTVISIEPASGERGGSVSADIKGSDFQADAAVELARSGEDPIAGTGVTVESASRITCDFDLTGEAPGPWDVVVTSGHSGVLRDGFVITAPDVSISKSAAGSGGDTFAPGDAVTYTLDIANEGDAPAARVIVGDKLPDEILNLSYHSTLTITPTGTISYTWQVAELKPGAGGAIHVYGQIDPGLGSAFSIRNEAAIDDPQDVTPANNTSSVTISATSEIFLPVVAKN